MLLARGVDTGHEGHGGRGESLRGNSSSGSVCWGSRRGLVSSDASGTDSHSGNGSSTSRHGSPSNTRDAGNTGLGLHSSRARHVSRELRSSRARHVSRELRSSSGDGVVEVEAPLVRIGFPGGRVLRELQPVHERSKRRVGHEHATRAGPSKNRVRMSFPSRALTIHATLRAARWGRGFSTRGQRVPEGSYA